MRVVIDTNVLIASISKISRTRIIFDAFLENHFTLVLSNEVLTEYEEIFAARTTPLIAASILELLLSSPNIELREIFYKWNLVERDHDDNKFADLYIASSADYLVTDDGHFNDLKGLSFPKINVISSKEFKNLLIVR